MAYNEGLERQVIQLIATDRIEIPISSLSGKLKRTKPKLAQAVELPDSRYKGERVYAKIEDEDHMKSRTLKDAIAEFCKEYPNPGKILQGKIAEKRKEKETHLYCGMNEGCRLTEADYLSVITELGFGEVTARKLYPDLIAISRSLSRKRDEERRILVGKTLEETAEE